MYLNKVNMNTWIYYIIFVVIDHVEGQQYSIQDLAEFSGSCQFGTPAIASDGVSVLLDVDKLQLNTPITEGFRMWTGYAEVYQNFVFKGCTILENTLGFYKFETKDLGRCFSFCQSKSQSFGIRGNICYCGVKTDNIYPCGQLTSNWKCDRPGGTFCGNNETKVAVYVIGNNDTSENELDEKKLCRVVSLSRRVYMWQNCYTKRSFLCQLAQRGNPRYSIFGEKKTWQASTEACLGQGYYPGEYSLDSEQNIQGNILLSDFWTGSVRGKVIITNKHDRNIPGHRQGHLIYKTGRFELVFDDQNNDTIRHILCVIQEENGVDGVKDISENYVVSHIIIPVLVAICAVYLLLFTLVWKRYISTKPLCKRKDNSTDRDHDYVYGEIVDASDNIEGRHYVNIDNFNL